MLVARPLLVAFLALGSARVAHAEPVAHAPQPVATAAQRKLASMHFQRALAHYRGGKYEAAIAELKLAIAQDAASKDLFYNLAIVHEKRGELEPAVASMQRYLTLETDPLEMARARYAIDRMRGARQQMQTSSSEVESQSMGRYDGWVLGTVGVAALGAIVGTVFGISALVTSPGSGDSTGGGTSIGELQDRADRAYTFALISDLAFAVSFASGAAAATLYFGRPRVVDVPLRSAQLKASPVRAGLDLTLAVSF